MSDLTPEEIMEALSQPFPVDSLHFRVGSTNLDKKTGQPRNGQDPKAIALAYIDSRDAMKRLDSVVGPQNWQRRYPWSDGGRLYCEVGIKIDGEWIWKGDGAGDTQVEAEKGAFSDAFKRACVNWGIAQYLYDSPNTWWPINQYKQFDRTTLTNIRTEFEKFQKRYFGANAGGPELAAAVEAINNDDPFALLKIARGSDYQSIFGKLTTKQKSVARDLEQRASKAITEYADGLKEAHRNDDEASMEELLAEIDNDTLKRAVWSNLPTETQQYIQQKRAK